MHVSDTERALRESEVRFRSLFENSPVAIFQYSIQRDRLLLANRALAKLLGYGDVQPLLDLPLSAAICISPEAHQALLKTVATTGQFQGDLDWRRKDGTIISVHVIARLAEHDRDVLEGSAENVTARKLFESHLQKVEKLKSIGGLAAGMAHELNNLHMVISSYSEMMLGELQSESLKRKADAIMRASHRASSLIQQLLAFSRKQTLDPRVLNAAQALNDIVGVLPGLLREDIETVFEWPPMLGNIRVDASQLRDALVNLASNSRDAMPHGGKFTITARAAYVSAEEAKSTETPMSAGRFVIITVTDTGVGMDRDTQARIFEPFFTTKPPGEGTGLGLSSAYGIVKQSSGWITVDSAPGRGTTFRIYLPLIEDPVDRTSVQIPLLDLRNSPATILLVEDEAGLREPVRDYLRKQGYRVIEAANGQEALERVEGAETKIDLLLTDVVMPRVNGPQLAERLRRSNPSLPVIFMSGYAEDKLGGTQSFTDSILLQKPFALKLLKARLEETLSPV
jgi:two-component system cell cycle sensor histidine kinase/response regulator CckA